MNGKGRLPKKGEEIVWPKKNLIVDLIVKFVFIGRGIVLFVWFLIKHTM
jgi:hypothetical protein